MYNEIEIDDEREVRKDKKKKKDVIVIQAYVKKDIKNKFQLAANNLGITESALVKLLINKYLDKLVEELH